MNHLASRLLPMTAAVLCALCLGSAQASEHDDEARSSAWWQWAVSIPPAHNPLLDTSGQACMVGQRGDVWFLAGSFGGTASRHCSVPEGVTLFFPVVNAINFDTPGVCGQVGRLSVADLRKGSAGFINGIVRKNVTLDGQPLRHVQRVRSPVFAVAVPKDNLFNSSNCVLPDAVYPRAVDDGYYAQIEALSVGEHTLQITASNGTGFDLNVTYRLNVVARDRR
jgi:hypothetical protein